MKILPITDNTQQSNISNNANFKAKLKIHGQKDLLPRTGLKRLKNKANLLGTKDDIIHIGLWNSYITEPTSNSFLNALGVPTFKIKESRTNVNMYHCFPSNNSTDEISEKVFGGTTKEQKFSAYKTIWKYIDSLKEKFETKL